MTAEFRTRCGITPEFLFSFVTVCPELNSALRVPFCLFFHRFDVADLKSSWLEFPDLFQW